MYVDECVLALNFVRTHDDTMCFYHVNLNYSSDSHCCWSQVIITILVVLCVHIVLIGDVWYGVCFVAIDI